MNEGQENEKQQTQTTQREKDMEVMKGGIRHLCESQGYSCVLCVLIVSNGEWYVE